MGRQRIHEPQKTVREPLSELAPTSGSLPTLAVGRPHHVAPDALAAGRREDPAAVRRTAAGGVRGTGSRLPHFATVQRAFGRFDLSSVRAFTHEAAAEASRSIGAAAYATGERVAFKEKNPSLETVAHEAAHVVQQRAGATVPGGVGRSGDTHERQADAVAQAVRRGRKAEPIFQRALPPRADVRPAQRPPVQRLIEIGKEPVNPTLYRTATNLRAPADTGFGGPGGASVYVGNDFSGGQIDAIRGNNKGNSNIGAAPALPALADFLESDESNNPLLPSDQARALVPEVDHIIPKARGGSNSINNARVLSATENTPGANVKRPAESVAKTAIRLYHAYDVKDTATNVTTNYAAGSTLNIGEANKFWKYAKNSTVANLNNTATFTKANLETIYNSALNQNRGGYKIT